MMILVHGSMKNYTEAKELFEAMVSQWNELNDSDSLLSMFEEVFRAIRQKRYHRSSSSSINPLKESDEDFYKPNFDVLALKHSSDILY
jgi:hypothetical protein